MLTASSVTFPQHHQPREIESRNQHPSQLLAASLPAVRVLPKRYAEAVGHSAFVASITISPIAKPAPGKGWKSPE